MHEFKISTKNLEIVDKRAQLLAASKKFKVQSG
jgi:hypothetical protein